jgi:hypothetical protein
MYDKKYSDGREKQEGIKTKMSSLQKADEEYYIASAYLLKIASRASELFESSEPAEKRELLKMLLLNCTLDARILHYALKKPFDSIFVFGNSQIWLAVALEVRKCVLTS